jgi:cytochrome P450
MQLASHVELAVESMVYQMFYGKGKEEEIEANVKEVVDAMSYINKFLNADNSVNFMPWLLYLKQGKIEEFKQAILATDKVTKLKAEERIATFEQGQVRDMVDALLAFSNEMPEEENAESFPRAYLIHQRVAFQTAIFDPVCRTILFIILYLTKYPEVQECVNTEISDVIGNDKAVGYKDRDNLPYLHAVILEVMRITSLVPTALPHSALHDTKLRGYDIDKDTMVFFNLHSVSHDKLFWGDPESFRPERLLNEQGHVDKEKCFRILYFGAGRRRCMGEMMAKILVFITTATLLQRCSFKKAEGCDLDTEPIRGAVYGPKQFKVIVQSK